MVQSLGGKRDTCRERHWHYNRLWPCRHLPVHTLILPSQGLVLSNTTTSKYSKFVQVIRWSGQPEMTGISSYYTPSSIQIEAIASGIVDPTCGNENGSNFQEHDKRVVTRMTHLWLSIRSIGTASRYKVQMRASEIASLPLDSWNLLLLQSFLFFLSFFLFLFLFILFIIIISLSDVSIRPQKY